MVEVAWLALIVSVISLLIVVWDRFPRAYVTIEKEYVVTEDDEVGLVKSGERLWITIYNPSAKRIFVTSIHAEWSKYHIHPFRYKRMELEDLQRWETADKPEPTARFWIEPWGNAVLSADAEEIEYPLMQRLVPLKEKISYRVIVHDGRKRQHKSNRIVLGKLNASLSYSRTAR